MSCPSRSSLTSTVISKTTPKVIAKTEMPRPKMAALRESRKEAEETQAAMLDPPPKSAWGGTMGSAIGTPKFTEVIAREVATQAQSSEIYQKLARPSGLSVAANDLSLRRHQAIGNVFDNGSQAAKQSQQSTFKGKERSYDRVYNRHEFREGLVFSAPTHEHDGRGQLVPQDAQHQSESNFGIVYSKYRKFVIIACFSNHAIALPIFTHEGRGLVNKNKDEFVSIREVDFKHSAAGPESKHGTLWADRFADIKANGAYSSWHSMANNTSVHLTSAQTHKYKTRCTISGQLEPASISYLQTLFTQSVLAKFPVGRSLQSEADDRFDTSNFRTPDHLKRTQSHNRNAPTGSQTLTPNGWGGSTTSRGGNSDMYRPSKLRC